MGDYLAQANEALALRIAKPRKAVALAHEVLRHRRIDPAARAVAHRTLAVCAHTSGERQQALRHANATARWSIGCTPELRSGCLVTAASVWFFAGRQRAALAAIDEATELHDSSDVRYTKAWMSYRAARWNEALVAHERLLADPQLELADQAMARSHLSLVLAEIGEQAAATEHAAAAIAIGQHCVEWEGLGFRAMLRYNAAYCLAIAGRLPDALKAFDELSIDAASDPTELAWVAEGHSGVLLRANLIDDALATAMRGLAAVGAQGPLELRGELNWRRAEAHAARNETAEAQLAATLAERLFRRMGHDGRADLARLAGLKARPATPGTISALRTLGRTFAADRRWQPAIDALTAAASLRQQTTGVARPAAGSSPQPDDETILRSARRHVPAAARARAWYGLALIASSKGDHHATLRASRFGLDALDETRAQLGSGEMRVRAAALSDDLLDSGLHAALAHADAWSVFDIIERARARSVLQRPARTDEMAAATAALHRLQRNPDTPAEAMITAEQAVRRASMSAGGAGARSTGLLRRGDFMSSLPPAMGVVSVFAHRGDLCAVVLADTVSLHHLGPSKPFADAAHELRFGLGRLCRANVAPAMASAMLSTSHRACAKLDEIVAQPIAAALNGRSPLIIPPGAFADLPFHTFETWASNDVRVVPAASWWSSRRIQTVDRQRALCVPGPNLVLADTEVARIAAMYPRGQVGSSTVETLVQAMSACDIVHIAAHGRLRADHPHLSSVQLADGDCTLYDLELADSTPDTVVLASCEVGGGALHAGDEVLGFVNELLSLGTRTVVASSRLVADEPATTFMSALHGSLSTGSSVAQAVRRACASLDPAVPNEFATRASFVAIGVAD